MKTTFGFLWREILRPIALVLALTFVLVAIVEGPPLDQFVYAVF